MCYAGSLTVPDIDLQETDLRGWLDRIATTIALVLSHMHTLCVIPLSPL